MNNKISVVLPFSDSFLDYPDNESLAIIVYTCGCEHDCPYCHNPQFQYAVNGTSLTYQDFESRILEALYKAKTNKLVFSGGDPLFHISVTFIKTFLEKHKKSIDVCIYTGYSIDYVKKLGVTGYKFIKCEKYCNELKQSTDKTDDVFILASKNQKLYNSKNKLISKDGLYKFGGYTWKSRLILMFLMLKKTIQPHLKYNPIYKILRLLSKKLKQLVH